MVELFGRPTIYNEEVILRVGAYLDECKEEPRLPSIEGLALFLGCNRKTIYEWEKLYPDLSNILEKVRLAQHEQLVNKGLSGKYNSTIAKLLLTSKHGYSDSAKTDLTSGGETINPVLVKFIDGKDN